MSHADTSTRTIKNSSSDALATLSCHATLLPSNQKIFSKTFMSYSTYHAITSHHTPSQAPTQAGNKLMQAANKLTANILRECNIRLWRSVCILLRVYDSNSSQCPTASDRRGPSGTWRGDLKAHAGAKQNVLRKVLSRSVWLDRPPSANAPAWVMPTHPRGLSRIHLRTH